jgi:hypothetical protein
MAQRALAEPLQPNQSVNALLGSRAVTRKKLLSTTLRVVSTCVCMCVWSEVEQVREIVAVLI